MDSIQADIDHCSRKITTSLLRTFQVSHNRVDLNAGMTTLVEYYDQEQRVTQS